MIEIVNKLTVLRHVELNCLVFHFHNIPLRILLQLRERDEVLIKHVDLFLLKVHWFDSTENAHVAFQVRDLLLLNFSDQFVFVQVRLHVLEATLHLLDFALQFLVLFLVLAVEHGHLLLHLIFHHAFEFRLHGDDLCLRFGLRLRLESILLLYLEVDSILQLFQLVVVFLFVVPLLRLVSLLQLLLSLHKLLESKLLQVDVTIVDILAAQEFLALSTYVQVVHLLDYAIACYGSAHFLNGCHVFFLFVLLVSFCLHEVDFAGGVRLVETIAANDDRGIGCLPLRAEVAGNVD